MKTKRLRRIVIPTILPIVEMGDPRLRLIAQSVMSFPDIELTILARQLLTTCRHFGGMGMSAPQVGSNMRVIVIAPKPNERRPNVKYIEPIVMVNPRIIARSVHKQEDYEGCLSFPGVYGKVHRYTWIKVTYVDITGKRFTKRFGGFVARVIQHEVDHLDGIMFSDFTSSRDLIGEQAFLAHVAASMKK
jgi:peptide deformylase